MLKIDNNSDDNSAIMEPCDSLTFCTEEAFRPDVVSDTEFKSIPINYDYSTGRSFLLLDSNERLNIPTAELFCKRINCSATAKIKVVTIFGNTGDGKSHTMNHAFFDGEEVFKTSTEQESCTLGVYAAMQPDLGVLCLDTEGLSSITSESNRLMRILLKVLSISDVVIYRTRAERLHSNMYKFLDTASKAFCRHLSPTLRSLSKQGSASLGPALIIFHETRHTTPLQNTISESAAENIRENFARLNYDIKAFSSLRYIGIQTSISGCTDYSILRCALSADLKNTAVRLSRTARVIFESMRTVNEKFSGEISNQPINSFTEQYLTCPVQCASCNRRCQRSMGHEGENHLNSQPCQYQDQFENKVHLCKSCYENGREAKVTLNVGWTYSTINCPNCGNIKNVIKLFNSMESCERIRTQTVHIWKDSNLITKGPTHSAQMVLDKVSYVYEAFANLSSQPAGAVKEWCADKIAPSYWKSNHEITHCYSCKKNFATTGLRKHHCRGCGEGFCDACTQYRMPVPSRNWDVPARVCSVCHQQLLKYPDSLLECDEQQTNDNHNSSNHSAGPININDSEVNNSEETDVTVRKCGETLYNTVSKVASAAIECTKEIIKDQVRPQYWVPDAEAVRCNICKIQFGTAEELALTHSSNATPQSPQKAFKGGDCKRHHCRKCGQGVCDDCSKTRRPVPDRGWLDAVRVCDDCVKDMSSSPNSSNSNPHQHTMISPLDDPKTKVE